MKRRRDDRMKVIPGYQEGVEVFRHDGANLIELRIRGRHHGLLLRGAPADRYTFLTVGKARRLSWILLTYAATLAAKPQKAGKR